MPRRSSIVGRMPRRDINQIAAAIVAQSTTKRAKNQPAKNPAAVALGRLGGLKGGHARAKVLTKAEKQRIAKKAAAARWAKEVNK